MCVFVRIITETRSSHSFFHLFLRYDIVLKNLATAYTIKENFVKKSS